MVTIPAFYVSLIIIFCATRDGNGHGNVIYHIKAFCAVQTTGLFVAILLYVINSAAAQDRVCNRPIIAKVP